MEERSNKRKAAPEDIYLARAAQKDFCRLGEVADSFLIFVLLLEDCTFFKHKHGFDLRLTFYAFCQFLRGRAGYGGSTITQQLAKNLYFSFEKRIKRKILELFYAADLEKHLTKEQILELYINTIYYDNGQYGICNASRFYFQKTPAELTDNQAFFLASLLPVVGLCNPLFQPEKFVKNRNRKLEDLPFSERIISENLAAEIRRHGPDCLDEELCLTIPKDERYNRRGPMINERFGPGGPEQLSEVKKSGSPLVEYVRLSPNYSGRGNCNIDRITPHSAAGLSTEEGIGLRFSNASAKASSNYGIGKSGRIGMYVGEDFCSWCSSNRENDRRAVTIECASENTEPYEMTNVVYQSLIRLCTDICRRNGKKKLLWLEDKEQALSYEPARDEMLLTVHRWFAAKPCPGDWLYSRLADLAAGVTAALAEPACGEKTAKE